MRYIDLRSDTVTMPTQEMRDAMFTAMVGDDVFDDDPTVKELEELAAKTLGKEAALFVTSGTQGNAVCVMGNTRRGDAIIVGRGCHILGHEAGSYAMLSGVSPCIPEDDHFVMRPQSIDALIADDSELQVARTGLVCVENAHSNGVVIPLDNMKKIYEVAHAKGVPVHLDGARLFNAAIVLGVDVKEMTQYCDTVMCCLSKGLCAPIGSVVAGSKEFIARAKKLRKALGGGTRQVGFLAAAGKIALTDMTARLAIDHENAKYLASKMKGIKGITIKEDLLDIDMIFYDLDWSDNLKSIYCDEMKKRGIKVTGYEGVYRMVTNKDVTREDCDTIVAALKDIVEKFW
ncbi:MAG: threonine aldolase family protein [Oscillospiraceae bacterium]